MEENNIDSKKYSLSVRQIVIGLFFIISAIITGTFLLTKELISDKNEALETQNIQKSETIEKLEKKLQDKELGLDNKNTKYSSESAPYSSTNDTSQVNNLLRKIEQLQKEKDNLYKEYIKISYTNLNPKSELSQLIKELNSKDEDIVEKAIEGLFLLKDSLSVQVLQDYYFENIEALSSYSTTLDWINLMWDINYDIGIDFTVKLFTNSDQAISDVAFWYFDKNIVGKKLMTKISNELKPIAMTNKSSFVRTRAKYIITEYEKRMNNESVKDRSMYEILLDIEKAIKDLN